MISPYIPLRARGGWIQSPSFHPRGVLGNARPKLAGPAPPPQVLIPPLPNCQVTHCRFPGPLEAFCESLIQAVSSVQAWPLGPRLTDGPL